MKNRKTFISMMLVFAMVFSLNIAPKVSNAAEDDTTTSTVCTVKIEAPYEIYYADDQYVYLDDADLKDDFGIGLATDGSDAIKNADGTTSKFTAIRAIAKSIREHIKHTKNITDDKEANKLMKDYIQYSNGYLTSFSNDGKNWNTGTYKGTASTAISGSGASIASGDGMTDGYWALFVDNNYSTTGVSITSAGDESHMCEIKYTWRSYSAPYGQPGFEVSGVGVIDDEGRYGDEEQGFELASKKTTFAVKKLAVDPATFAFADKFTAVSGASVSVFDDLHDKKEVYTAKTDSKGQFTIKKNQLKPGSYTIVAWEEAENAQKKTFSKMIFTARSLILASTPKTPTGVKAKFDKKKKKFTVSWKPAKDASDYYEVYHSTKKNGKYRLAKEVVGKKKVTIKRGKGIKYVKVIHKFRYVYGPEGSDHVRDLYGSFTKPVKIK